METSIDDLVSLAKRKNVPVTTDSAPKKKKHKRNEKSGNQVVQPSQMQDGPPSNNYPYPVVPDDHCESPMEAYQDISSFLLAICKNLSKTPETLRIFDPYFCEGRMKERLNSLGFKTVYNEKKDFYESIRSNTLPEFDVLITNPPYSGDHMERLLRFCTGDQCNKPWFLLLPNYVYTKDYYANIFGGESVKKSTGKAHHGHSASPHQQQQTEGAVRKPFYVTPAGTRRYMYTTPKGRRQEKSAKYTSPFPTFWYCQAYERRDNILSQAAAIRTAAAKQHPPVTKATTAEATSAVEDEQKEEQTTPAAEVAVVSAPKSIVVALSVAAIPLEHAPDNDPRKKKLRNNQKRSKNKMRKKTGQGNNE